VTGNYGYVANNNSGNIFQMQPIIVGLGGSINSAVTLGNNGGTGCGGGAANSAGSGGNGGNGMAVIITW
jgi:hypothetical protein